MTQPCRGCTCPPPPTRAGPAAQPRPDQEGGSTAAGGARGHRGQDHAPTDPRLRRQTCLRHSTRRRARPAWRGPAWLMYSSASSPQSLRHSGAPASEAARSAAMRLQSRLCAGQAASWQFRLQYTTEWQRAHVLNALGQLSLAPQPALAHVARPRRATSASARCFASRICRK